MVLKNFKMKFHKIKENLIENIFIFNYWTYVFVGFWKYEFDSYWKNILHYNYRKFVNVIYCLTVMCFIFDLYLVIDNIEKLSLSIVNSAMVFVSLTKFYILFKSNQKLEELLKKLDNHLFVDGIGKSLLDVEILRKANTNVFYLTESFYCLIATGLLSRVLADTAFDARILMIPIPYKNNLEEYYGFFYVLTFGVSLHFFGGFISHEMIVFGIIVRIVGHFQVLNKNIEHMMRMYEIKSFGTLKSKKLKFAGLPKNNFVEIRKNKMKHVKQCSSNNYLCETSITTSWKKLRERQTTKKLKNVIRHHQKILEYVKLSLDIRGAVISKNLSYIN